MASSVKALPTIYVPDDYSTIQAAVDHGTTGDTIIVRAGTYNEAITVDKDNLTIRGVDRDTVIVYGTGLHGASGFTIGTLGAEIQGVTIQGFTIRNFDGHGIYVVGDKNAITDDQARDNTVNGIFVWGNNNTISRNVATRNGSYGIVAYFNNNTISDNKVMVNSLYGIRFSGDNNRIKDNAVSGNAVAGIEFC